MSEDKWRPFADMVAEMTEFLKTVKRQDGWWWDKNHRCKYVSVHIDMRDGHAILIDRDGKHITFEELRRQ